MTMRPIKVLPDGTRVYSNHTRYVPVPLNQRKYRIRKPDDPRAVMYNRQWFLPMELVPDGERDPVPETRPDTDAFRHKQEKTRKCRCNVCHRPEAQRWKDAVTVPD